jgi:hypothetical protein
MVQAGLLEESLNVIYRRQRLAHATMCRSRNVAHVRAACSLIVAIVIVSHGRNALRTLIVPLLSALGALLGIMDGDIRRSLLVTTRGCLPAS